jgi:hypothetical protein
MRLVKVMSVLVLVAAASSGLHATAAVPELDPGSLGSVCMLLGGVLLIIRGRRK